jgi:hypothetical protein
MTTEDNIEPNKPSGKPEGKPAPGTHTAGGEGKLTRKQFILHEARAIFSMIVYLAVSLSLLGTFRCLVLIQHGINDFAHSYVVAIVMAVALGKIVVLGQKLPFLTFLDQRPLIYSVFYKAAIMTFLAHLATMLEEHLFPKLHASTGSTEQEIILTISRQFALFCIFWMLFVWRDLDRVLGYGTLFRLFFFPRQGTPGPIGRSARG